MQRHPRRIAIALGAALACTAFAAPVAHAEQQPAAEASVTVTLGPTLDGLLGGDAQQQPLQDLLAALQGGQAPTGTALAPLQDLLLRLAATPGLPPDVQALIAQLAALLGSAPAGQPLDPALLMPVATLLRDLAGTSGVPAELVSLLNGLADLLDGDGRAGPLPIDDALALPPALVDRLGALLEALERGEQPTGTALEPVRDLLESVAATKGLPDGVSSLLNGLAGSVDRTSGELDPLLAGQVRYALDSIAATPGLTPAERTTIERISTFVATAASGSPAAARKATKRDRAVIKRIRVNRARTRIGVRIACPRSAPRACATTVTAKLGRRKAANGKRVRIAAGRSKVVRLRMVRAARTASTREGGRLRVRVATKFGTQRFATTKAVKLKPRNR